MAETVYSTTLLASSTDKDIHPLCNADAGGYGFFKLDYRLRRDSIQQIGEMIINDTGTSVEMDHEWSILPTGQNPNVIFSVGYSQGVRRLWYRTTTGSSPIYFSFVLGPSFG